MFTSQREEWEEPRIIALVELDIQNMRLRIILACQAIRERLLELERSTDHHSGTIEHPGVPDSCAGGER
jgi:hypothetical protein